MSTIYRLHSVAFGEYLEKMAFGLIDKYIYYLSDFGFNGKHNCYYRVGWVLAGEFKIKRVYTIEVCDGTTMDQLIKGLNDAYAYIFRSEVDNMNIRGSLEDCSWDKYNETYLKVLRIDDSYFSRYHDDAVRFWLQ